MRRGEAIEKDIFHWLTQTFPGGPQWHDPAFHALAGAPLELKMIAVFGAIEGEIGQWRRGPVPVELLSALADLGRCGRGRLSADDGARPGRRHGGSAPGAANGMLQNAPPTRHAPTSDRTGSRKAFPRSARFSTERGRGTTGIGRSRSTTSPASSNGDSSGWRRTRTASSGRWDG